MARGRALGVASGDGPVGRVGNRIEKYSVVFVLPFIDLLLFEMGRTTADYADTTGKNCRRKFNKLPAKIASSMVL